MKYVLLRNVKCKVMLTEAYLFRTKSNIYNGAFFTSAKPYFKKELNLIELPLGSTF